MATEKSPRPSSCCSRYFVTCGGSSCRHANGAARAIACAGSFWIKSSIASRRFQASRCPSTKLADDRLKASAHFAKLSKAATVSFVPANAATRTGDALELLLETVVWRTVVVGTGTVELAFIGDSRAIGGAAKCADGTWIREKKNSPSVVIPTNTEQTMIRFFKQTLLLDF
jgi:hypothetical protein